MQHKIYTLIFLFAVAEIQAQTAIINFTDYKVQNQNKVDSNMIKLLQPYYDSLNKMLNRVIGFSVYGLYKKQPEGSLGNMMADAMKMMSEKKYNVTVDAAIINTGSIQSYIAKGDVTVGKIYELIPFDNAMVILQIKGNVLQSLLNKSAEKNGWSVSNIKMQIKDKKAVNVFISDKPLDETATYTIACTDYIAAGGDECTMLKNI